MLEVKWSLCWVRRGRTLLEVTVVFSRVVGSPRLVVVRVDLRLIVLTNTHI